MYIFVSIRTKVFQTNVYTVRKLSFLQKMLKIVVLEEVSFKKQFINNTTALNWLTNIKKISSDKTVLVDILDRFIIFDTKLTLVYFCFHWD